ncbi:hypothetical protein M8J77_024083 [Diaphorina citri]|nr:hypothetical protein M8J77_024083 [Diaphorina citri]
MLVADIAVFSIILAALLPNHQRFQILYAQWILMNSNLLRSINLVCISCIDQIVKYSGSETYADMKRKTSDRVEWRAIETDDDDDDDVYLYWSLFSVKCIFVLNSDEANLCFHSVSSFHNKIQRVAVRLLLLA